MKRTRTAVYDEYADKWAAAKGAPDVVEAARWVFDKARRERGAELGITFGRDVLPCDWMTYVAARRHVLRSAVCGHLGAGNPGIVCELGCGIGLNLTCFPEARCYGGEFVTEAIDVARNHNLEVQRFDFYRTEDYALIRHGSVVVTFQAIEQLPDATVVLDGLRRYKDRVRSVVHLEPQPTCEERDSYLRENDYNRNLKQLLDEASDIRITRWEPDVFGTHARNLVSVIAWEWA